MCPLFASVRSNSHTSTSNFALLPPPAKRPPSSCPSVPSPLQVLRLGTVYSPPRHRPPHHHAVFHRRGVFRPPRVDSQLYHNMRQPPHLPRASCHRAESSFGPMSSPRINLSPTHLSVFIVISLRRRWSGHIYTPPPVILVLVCTLFRQG